MSGRDVIFIKETGEIIKARPKSRAYEVWFLDVDGELTDRKVFANTMLSAIRKAGAESLTVLGVFFEGRLLKGGDDGGV